MFELKPYFKNRKGSDEAPVFDQRGNSLGILTKVITKHCSQLCIPCKTCKGEGMVVKYLEEKDDGHVEWKFKCTDCSDGLEVYTGSKCGDCGGKGVEPTVHDENGSYNDPCKTCKMTGKIDHTAEIVELLQVEKPKQHYSCSSEEWWKKVRKYNEAQARLTKLTEEI